MALWNPWRGCHKFSEGCRYCYIHKGDYKRNIDTNIIRKTSNFYLPLEKNKKNEFKLKPNSKVYVCFSSDFLINEADPWRDECWSMIKERSDLHFIFLTKRIHRLENHLPKDWGDGYDNITIGCTVENQKAVNFRLPIFNDIPIKHRNIICQPLIERVNLENYLSDIELVVVGGESDYNARVLNYDWVLEIREQCINNQTSFEFRQCGTNFIKDNKQYRLNNKLLMSQAKKANINYNI